VTTQATARVTAEEPARIATVPFHRPDIGEAEIAAVVETLRSGWLTTGPKTLEFETAFAEGVGARHAIAVSSCTAALHLALDALGLEPGDEVIVPTLTFTSTGATVVHAGARPVLADVTADTLNVDPRDVARKITRRTRAIVAVHFAGHPAPMDELLELADRHGIALVEDAAHALPAAYRGRRIGSIGKFTAFSFYATKNLTTGEGGMLTTDDSLLADRVRMRRLHGMSRDAWKRYSATGTWRYDVSYPGFKYNLTDVASAIGLVQLGRLPELQRRREEIARRYTEALEDVADLRLPGTRREVEHAWHLYVVRVRPQRLRINRDQLIEVLKERGIGTSVHFIPLHWHSYYQRSLGVGVQDLPVASEAAETMLSLPLFTRMSDDEVDHVAATLRDVLSENRG
jgi:dTDP-4-amino-4,6-dideoxygalactose transaminase